MDVGMDGTKRSANGKHVPRTQPIDLGATPPWALPPTYHEESALRYTQSPEGRRTINSITLLPRSTITPQTAPSRPTLNEQATELLQQNATALRPQTRRRIGKLERPVYSPLTQDGHEQSEDGIQVDTDDDNDGVYMINAQDGSWSRPLESEDHPKARDTLPDQAVLALQHLKRAHELTQQEKQQSELTHKKWHTDMLVRNIVRRMKHKLQTGSHLTLERVGPVDLTIICAHPLCPAPERKIPSGAYDITLSPPGQSESAGQYCLFCLEDLWNGKGMIAPFPGPEVVEPVSSLDMDRLALGLDGAMDDEKLVAAGLQSDNRGTGTSTPSSRSAWSGGEEVPTPATRYTWTASPSSNHGAQDNRVDFQSRLSPVDRTPSGRSTSLEDSGCETLAPVIHVKLAKKRGLDHAKAVASSETLRNVKNQIASRELRDLTTGFGEAFLEGQLHATRRRGENQSHVVRHSARLQSADDDGAVSSVIRKPGITNQRTLIQPSKPPTSTDATFDAVAKAEQRLKGMYRQRDTLASLGPGKSAIVRHLSSRKSVGGHHVAIDVFGVSYTDLLAEHVRYYVKPGVSEDGAAVQLLHSSLIGPIPERLRPVAEREAKDSKEEDGYAVDESDAMGATHSPPLSAADVERLFRPPYADGETIRCYMLGSAQLDETLEIPRDLDSPRVVHLPSQYDGAPDHYEAPNISQTLGPASLMESRHAPTAEELLRAVTPQPGKVSSDHRPKTPGGPYSPDSTTSTGIWKKPPARFQHLAAYVRAGSSLHEEEKAALEVWKAASAEQLNWEKHLRDAEGLRRRYAIIAEEGDEGREENLEARTGIDWLTDGGEDGQVKDGGIVGEGDGDVVKMRLVRRDSGNAAATSQGEGLAEEDETLEEEAGITRRECRGKDLSTVLAEVR